MLSPVLFYCLVSFWLSVYRDHEAQQCLRVLAQFKIKEAAAREYAVSEKRRSRKLDIIERFRKATAERSEESEEIQKKIEAIGEEFRKNCAPVQKDHAAAYAEFERRRREGLPRDPKLEETMSNLGAQIEEFAARQDEETRPLTERFDALMNDPEIRKLDLKMDSILDESPREWRKYSERTSLLTHISTADRRWRTFWSVLEVIFPSALGVFGILFALRGTV